jgi:putative cell wall-binding protein
MPQYSRPAGPSFVSDGRLVVAVDEAGRNVGDTLYVIDPATGAVQARVPGVGDLPEASPDGKSVYSTLDTSLGIIDLATIGWHPAVDRIAGTDRYSTSVAVSTTMFPEGAPVAYVVSGEGFADALSASTAAAERGGPLLLTPRGSIPSQVLAELKRLQPKRIVVVGGPASVAPAAVSALKALGVPVAVLSGADRYATARAVIDDTWPEGAEHVFVASGASFPDALSAASAAHSVDAPLLIVPGAAAHLDATTTSLLKGAGASRFTIVGGPVGVTAGIAADLAKSGSVERLAGADRFETSAAVNEAAFPSPDRVYLASGVQFPDALSGGVLAALNDAPLFVVPPSCIPTRVADRLAAVPTSAVTLVGGKSALTERAGLLGIC